MPSDKPVVHVIDDDEAMRESLAFLLGAVGLEVRTYDSALAFLDVAPNAEAGCVITDVRMPGLSGVDLLRRLRELKLGIPVIVITGHGDVPLAVEAMKIGALDFLEKPFDDEVLLASVRSALNQLDQDRKTPGASATKSSVGLQPCRTASATCWRGSSAGMPTSRSPMTSASARARSRSTGRT